MLNKELPNAPVNAATLPPPGVGEREEVSLIKSFNGWSR